jgi:sulfate permease, SulP family
VLGIVISSALSLSSHGVAIVGHVPSGLPTPGVPSVDSADIPALLAAAGGMVLVIFSESLGAANNFAVKHGYEIDASQELIALGVANAGSGVLGGLAGGGSLSQSAVNEGAGARSEASTLIAGLLIVVTVLLLTPLFKSLPEAVLAALIIHAVSHLWKIRRLRIYYAERQAEFWLGLATLLGVVTIDVLPGLVIGVVGMLLMVIHGATVARVSVLARLPGGGAFVAIDRHPEAVPVSDVLLLRLDSALFYANAAPVCDRIKRLVGQARPGPKAVILDVGVVDRLDLTSAEVMDELVRVLHSAGLDVGLAEVRQPVVEMARRTGLVDTVGEARIFHTIDEALEAIAGAPAS